MPDLAILADDLTGALDAAAAFASPARPVTVGWLSASGDRIAIDSETRALPRDAARARVEQVLPLLARSLLPFKKIDSLLRGNSFAEIAACSHSGLFDVIYVTPAFPSQGRTVSAGTLHSGTTGRSVSIIEGLAAEGLTATVVTPGAELPLSGVVVCDAATEADLTGLVEKVAPGERMLWCGSAGLARAMAGATTSVTTTPTLAIIGSRHPVSRAQGAMLAASLGASCARLRDVRDISAECAAIAAALLSYGRAALVFELPEMTDVAAERVYCETFGALAGLSQPTSIVVVGGDTLFRLVSAIGVRGLRVLGEHSPGVPVSQLEGGRWDGTIVTSKSGAFSDSGLFQTFVHGELQSA